MALLLELSLIHAGPAQATLVVGVIGESAVGGVDLCRNPSEYQVADLGDTGKLRSHRHINLLEVLRRVRPGDGKIHQSGGPRSKGFPAAFSMPFSTASPYQN